MFHRIEEVGSLRLLRHLSGFIGGASLVVLVRDLLLYFLVQKTLPLHGLASDGNLTRGAVPVFTVFGGDSAIQRIRAVQEVYLVHKLDEINSLSAWSETCIVVLAHGPQEVGQLLSLVLEWLRTAHRIWGTLVSLG